MHCDHLMLRILSQVLCIAGTAEIYTQCQIPNHRQKTSDPPSDTSTPPLLDTNTASLSDTSTRSKSDTGTPPIRRSTRKTKPPSRFDDEFDY